MHKEVIQKKHTALEDFLRLFGVIILLLISSVLFPVLGKAINIPALEYITYILAIAFAVMLYNSQRVYTYMVDKGLLYFERGLGRSAKPIAALEMEKIISFSKWAEDQHGLVNGKKPVILKATIYDIETSYVVTFGFQDKIYKVVFHPSDEMVGLIEGGMKMAAVNAAKERGIQNKL